MEYSFGDLNIDAYPQQECSSVPAKPKLRNILWKSYSFFPKERSGINDAEFYILPIHETAKYPVKHMDIFFNPRQGLATGFKKTIVLSIVSTILIYFISTFKENIIVKIY